MRDDGIPDGAMQERKDLRVRLPVEQHLKLHKLKVLTDQTMSDVVREALKEYMDVESIALNEAVRDYLESRVPALPSVFEVETDLRDPPKALIDRSGVHGFLESFLDEVESTWEGGGADGDPRILVETGNRDGEAVLTLEIQDVDLPEGVCERHLGFFDEPSKEEITDDSTMARLVANIEGGLVGCGYRDNGNPRFTARFSSP